MPLSWAILASPQNDNRKWHGRKGQSAHLGELWYRGNIVFWVTDTLDKDAFRLVIDGRGKLRKVVSVDELDADAIFLERHCRRS